MPPSVTVDEAINELGRCSRTAIIAIDGLPCSGKSTMTARLKERLDADVIELDEFVLPEAAWPAKHVPAFPFQYIRYASFLSAVEALANTGACSFYPFDWRTLTVSNDLRIVKLTKPVVIDGVSALNPSLCAFYEKRVFIESDRGSCLQAALARGGDAWAAAWRDLFLPSADLYMQTSPQLRADILVAGRAAIQSNSNKALLGFKA